MDYGAAFMKPSFYKTGAMAKKAGGKGGLLLNGKELEEWNRISEGVQREICRWKLDNFEEVKRDLMKSGTRLLVHPALRCSEEKLERTAIWEGKGIVKDGKIVVLGKNRLGNIWMDFR